MSIKRLGGRTDSTRVSLSPSKIPYGGFSPVRLQTRSRRRPSRRKQIHLYDAQVRRDQSLWPRRACNRVGLADTLVQRPLAHRRLCCPAGSMLTMASSEPLVTAETPYFLRPSGNHGSEWVPNLVYVSVRACHPQHPGGPIGSS